MDAHAVTFRNLKVLMSHLNTPEPQFEGKPRRGILCEEGFRFVKRRGSDELEQAAADAVAYCSCIHCDGETDQSLFVRSGLDETEISALSRRSLMA